MVLENCLKLFQHQLQQQFTKNKNLFVLQLRNDCQHWAAIGITKFVCLREKNLYLAGLYCGQSSNYSLINVVVEIWTCPGLTAQLRKKIISQVSFAVAVLVIMLLLGSFSQRMSLVARSLSPVTIGQCMLQRYFLADGSAGTTICAFLSHIPLQPSLPVLYTLSSQATHEAVHLLCRMLVFDPVSML